MGTPAFAVPVLESLVLCGCELVAVYTQPDKPAGRGRKVVPSPVKEMALECRLDIRQPVSLRAPEETAQLASLEPDLIIVAAFGQLLPQAILDVPRHSCLNVHPSLLPRHRGASPIPAAILAGDETTGVSIMLMDRGMDTGPIVAQQEVPLLPQDTAASLADRLAQIGSRLLVSTLPLWLTDELTTQPQGNEMATYCPQITKESGRIDWHRTAVELWRSVRAFQPWPGCHTTWQGKQVKIIQAVPLPGKGEPGTVVAMPDGQPAVVGVNTGEGILGLLQLQAPGRRVTGAEEFIRGHRDFAGALLPS